MSDPTGEMPNESVPQVVQDTAAKAPTEVVKNVVIIFLVGVAIVLGLLLVTYLLMVIMDKYCCCMPGWRAAGDSVQIDRGPVARKAGLWGLRREEREAILQHLLVGKPYTPDMIQNNDEENPTITENVTEETSESRDDDNPNGTMDDEEANEGGTNGCDEEKGDENQEGEQTNEEKEEDNNIDLDEADHDVVCAICLSEYGTWE